MFLPVWGDYIISGVLGPLLCSIPSPLYVKFLTFPPLTGWAIWPTSTIDVVAHLDADQLAHLASARWPIPLLAARQWLSYHHPPITIWSHSCLCVQTCNEDDIVFVLLCVAAWKSICGDKITTDETRGSIPAQSVFVVCIFFSCYFLFLLKLFITQPTTSWTGSHHWSHWKFGLKVKLWYFKVRVKMVGLGQ